MFLERGGTLKMKSTFEKVDEPGRGDTSEF